MDGREIVGKREFPRGAGRWMNAAQEYEETALFYDAHGPEGGVVISNSVGIDRAKDGVRVVELVDLEGATVERRSR